MVPKIEIGRVFLLYELEFIERFFLYRMEEDFSPCEVLIFEP